MSVSVIPSWSASAAESIGLLYRELQPIEVYVEDSNSEAFYFELLNRIIDGPAKIRKVIPLHGRNHVVTHCDNFDHRTSALFLIDGDLDVFIKERVVGRRNLFQHTAYCVENYLICKNAARELIVEASGTVLRKNAITDDEWNAALAPLQRLKHLFITFAAAREAYPELKTVSHGFSAIITQKFRKRPPEIDYVKIEQLNKSITCDCIAKVGQAQWEEIRAKVEAQSAEVLPIDGVSGKDFILPILDHFVRSKGCNTSSTASLMFKLAKYCSLDRLQNLKFSLQEVLAGRHFISS